MDLRLGMEPDVFDTIRCDGGLSHLPLPILMHRFAPSTDLSCSAGQLSRRYPCLLLCSVQRETESERPGLGFGEPVYLI